MTRAAAVALAMHRRRPVDPIDYLTMARRLFHKFALDMNMPRSEIAYRIAKDTHDAMDRRYKRSAAPIREREQHRWEDAMAQFAPSPR